MGTIYTAVSVTDRHVFYFKEIIIRYRKNKGERLTRKSFLDRNTQQGIQSVD